MDWREWFIRLPTWPGAAAIVLMFVALWKSLEVVNPVIWVLMGLAIFTVYPSIVFLWIYSAGHVARRAINDPPRQHAWGFIVGEMGIMTGFVALFTAGTMGPIVLFASVALIWWSIWNSARIIAQRATGARPSFARTALVTFAFGYFPLSASWLRKQALGPKPAF